MFKPARKREEIYQTTLNLVACSLRYTSLLADYYISVSCFSMYMFLENY